MHRRRPALARVRTDGKTLMLSMRRRIVTLCILTVAGLAVFVCPRLTLTANEAAASSSTPPQRAGRQRRLTPARRAQRTARDYGRFLHRSATHLELSCNACHRVPTANWRTASAYPDVTDYPSHDACVRCHRPQFFKGARPAICTVCHMRVAPREKERFAFRHPARARQFTAEFPHDKHQDVIASRRRRLMPEATTNVAFMPAVLVVAAHRTGQDAPKQYNNCAICHATNPQSLPPPAGGWPDAFTPPAGTFKTVPTTHASCFNCHWKSQPPVRDDCAGCHKPATAATLAASSASPPQRISNKFTHTREEHVAECTTCHIHITAASTLRGLKPDVPITSCSECHKARPDSPETVTIATEIDRRQKERNFACAKCHTSDVGRRDVPASHTALFD